MMSRRRDILSSMICLLRSHSSKRSFLICPISCLEEENQISGKQPDLVFIIIVDDFLVQNMCLSLITLFVKVIVLRKPLNHKARLIDNLNVLRSCTFDDNMEGIIKETTFLSKLISRVLLTVINVYYLILFCFIIIQSSIALSITHIS